MKILILTKTVLAEKDIQKKLQTLGHEVFVSSKYLRDYLENKLNRETVNYFSVCIISKTISESEANELFSKFNSQPYNFLREVEKIPEALVNGSHSYVKENASIAELRETIASLD